MAASDTDPRLTGAITALFDDHFDGPPGSIGVAVSGGSDSMALLMAVLDWAALRGAGPVRCVTVDHGLRPEAAAEARSVAEFCTAHGVSHETLTLGLEAGPGLQARARTARYDALTHWANRTGTPVVLLGHTADDVAETLLMRLARGTGIDGLAAMPAYWRSADGVRWGRPLLGLTRVELRSALTGRGVSWVDDPSNDDPSFERVQIRQQMAATGLDPLALARSAQALRQARNSLARRAVSLTDTLLTLDRGDMLVAQAAWRDLHKTEPEQLRRLTAALLTWIGDGPPRGAELDRLTSQVLDDASPRATLSGCTIRAEARDGVMHLRFAREVAACGPAVPLGQTWDRRWRLFPPPDWPGEAATLTLDRLDGDLPDHWREIGLPRDSLRASPALRDTGGNLVAAPLAQPGSGWRAMMVPSFASLLLGETPAT